ncbi:MAG: putative metal-binding motif-containing protein [Candidatus Woesearchaeota archaeon]
MTQKRLVRTLLVIFIFLVSNVPFSAFAENGGSIGCMEDSGCPDSECGSGACDIGTGTCYLVPLDSSQECRPLQGDCDIAESCDGIGTYCPADLKSLQLCRPASDVCDEPEICDGVSNYCPQDVLKLGVECRPAGACEFAAMCDGFSADCPANQVAPDQTPCEDSFFCTENDVCYSGLCSGNPVDCSANDLIGVQTCDYSPDDYHPTWDYRSSYVSSCIEQVDGYLCSSGVSTVSHECSVSLCSAECDASGICPNSTCESTYDDYCSAKKLVEYDSDKVQDSTTVSNSVANRCLADCTCSDNSVNCPAPSTSTYCVAGVCDAQCGNDNDCQDYCAENGHTLWRGDCNSDCECSYLSMFDCNTWDGWQDVDSGTWVPEGQCKLKKQVQQNFQEGLCPLGGDRCVVDVLDTRLVDTGEIQFLSDYLPCDDGLYCTANDYCLEGECVSSQRDCSGDNLLIDTCNYEPDGLSVTLDYYSFASVCDEESDECTSAPIGFEVAHSCNMETCDAECEESSDCVPYCDGNTYHYGGICAGCACSYISRVCVGDGWYLSGATQWVSTGECTEKEQQGLEYRDYYCSVEGCIFNVTNTKWDDTGSQRNKQDGSVCSDWQFCTANDYCESGVCLTGPNQTACSDSFDCTADSCDEENDQCVHSTDDSVCDDSLWCNGQEYCSADTGCEPGNPPLDCSVYDLAMISQCDYSPDDNSLTLDQADGFVSSCDEALQSCTNADYVFTHECSIACSAECVDNSDCDDLNPNTMDYCDSCLCQHQIVCGNSVLDFPEQCELPGTFNNEYCSQSVTECSQNKIGARDSFGNCDDYCGCVEDDFSYACIVGSCGAECESAIDCPDKCVGSIFMAQASCTDNCECSYVQEDCSQYDGWYDTETTRLIEDSQCTEKEQILRQYRHYSCAVGCDYSVESSMIQDTLSETETRTYTLLGVDYEVQVAALSESGAIFVVNGQAISQLAESESFELLDGTVLQVVTILAQDFAGGTLLVEFTLTSPAEWQDTGIVMPKPDTTSCEDDDLCTLDDSCSAGVCVSGTQKECSDSIGCTVDSCESLTGECLHNPDSAACDDGLFCNGNEYCDTLSGCLAGAAVECSYLDLPQISQCGNDPDSNPLTFDYAPAVPSVCDEESDECTRGIYSYTHECEVGCGADCDATHGCADSTCSVTYEDYCDERKLMEYDGDSMLGSTVVEDSQQNSCLDCLCTANQASCPAPVLTANCVAGVCDAECKTSEECPSYCDGSLRYYDSSCSDGCECMYDFEDCDQHDGYYDTGALQLVSTGECTQKEQKEQELRDYSCAPDACTYLVIGYQWVDTGVNIDKPDATLCDDGLYCSVDDACILGSCVGAARDCSASDLAGIAECSYSPDGNPLTWDTAAGFTSVCDDDDDACTTSSYDHIHSCSMSLCGAECELDSNCASTECDGLDGCYFGTYFDYSDEANFCLLGCSCTENSCEDFAAIVTDADMDSYDVECEEDCDDADNTVYPGALELCDAKDNDCDGVIDSFNQDCSVRFKGICSNGQEFCSAGTWDGCPLPQFEVCDDGLDNDCDGVIDNGCRILHLLNPGSEVYYDRIVPVATDSGGRSDMYYSLDDSSWRLLCKNCNIYDKPMQFRYGSHVLSVIASYPDGIASRQSVWFVVARPDSVTGGSATWTGMVKQGVYSVAQVRIVETKNFRSPMFKQWGGPSREDFMSSTVKLSIKNLPSIGSDEDYVLWLFNSKTNEFRKIGLLSLNKRQGSQDPYNTGIIGYLSTQGSMMYENLLDDFDGAIIERQPKGYGLPYPLGDALLYFNKMAPMNFLADGANCVAHTQCQSELCDPGSWTCESVV